MLPLHLVPYEKVNAVTVNLLTRHYQPAIFRLFHLIYYIFTE